MIRWLFKAIRVGCLLGCLAAWGCGSGEPTPKEVPPAYQNLKSISSAYLQATNSLKRPPKNLDELMPFLKKQGDPATLLRSPDDGEEYVIVWGVDYRTPPSKANSLPVLAYEKVGKHGKRQVLQMRNIVQLTDEELKNAPLPLGHKLPF